MTLCDAMDQMYERYGYFLEKQISFEEKGVGAMERITAVTDSLRAKGAGALAAFGPARMEDLLKDRSRGLPKSNVLLYTFENGWAAVRPSGTEPKLKLYIGVRGATKADAEALLERLETVARDAVSGQ